MESLKIQKSGRTVDYSVVWPQLHLCKDMLHSHVKWSLLRIFYLIGYFFKSINLFLAVSGLRRCVRISLAVANGSYPSLRCMGFSLQWLLLLQSLGSRHAGFSSCGAQPQQLWLMGLVAPQHVGSSQTRDRTRVPCIGRQILNHCTTREVVGLISY